MKESKRLECGKCRFSLLVIVFLFCFFLIGCVTMAQAETAGEETPVNAEAPPADQAPAPAASDKPLPEKATGLEKFISDELLPQEKKQIINPKKATYKLFGIDRDAKKAAEEEMAEKLNLPIMNVSTVNQEYILSCTEYLSCVIDVFNCPEEWILEEASAGIRVRGNSSAYYGNVDKILENQVPYRIKFDKKTSLLGLNNGAKCKSWVLLKAGYDLIRNDLALRFGRKLMNGHAFCSDACFVHVYVNDIYQGIYTLCEQCQVDPNRVNITEPEKNYTGIDIGYYIEIDNKPEYPAAFKMDYGGYQVEDMEGDKREFINSDYSIKSDVYTQGQVDFIGQYTRNVFEIVYQACEKGKYFEMDENYDLVPASFSSAQETVDNVLDIESVINMYLLYELMHDYDVGEGSFYMCVDFSKNSECRKLQFTSPWDFNWTCKGSYERYWAASFCELSFVGEYGDRTNPWFVLLMRQDWFRRLVSEKWTELAKTDEMNLCIDREIDILEIYKKDLTIKDKHAVNNAYEVVVWLQQRVKWMNTQFLIAE